jgi:predicted GH43/DUF377 family glycosyl hydrolase
MRFVDQYAPISIQPRDRILSTVSTDGLTWQREIGVRCQVNTITGIDMVYYCSAILLPNRIWRVYYLGATARKGQWSSNIYSVYSKDGLKWEQELGYRIKHGGKYDTVHCRAPSVIRLAQGFRMYYVGIDHKGICRLLSAYSNDGLNWNKEPGVRISPDMLTKINVNSFEDVAVAKLPTGEFRLYFTGISRKFMSQIYSAVSEDGMNWQIEPGVRIANHGHHGPVVNNPSVVMLEDGTWRLYYRSGKMPTLYNDIYAAHSADGLAWESYGPVLTHNPQHRYERHAVAFPHVVRLSDGRWRMYYTGYWGRHLLERRTMRSWQKQLKQFARGDL